MGQSEHEKLDKRPLKLLAEYWRGPPRTLAWYSLLVKPLTTFSNTCKAALVVYHCRSAAAATFLVTRAARLALVATVDGRPLCWRFCDLYKGNLVEKPDLLQVHKALPWQFYVTESALFFTKLRKSHCFTKGSASIWNRIHMIWPGISKANIIGWWHCKSSADFCTEILTSNSSAHILCQEHNWTCGFLGGDVQGMHEFSDWLNLGPVQSWCLVRFDMGPPWKVNQKMYLKASAISRRSPSRFFVAASASCIWRWKTCCNLLEPPCSWPLEVQCFLLRLTCATSLLIGWLLTVIFLECISDNRQFHKHQASVERFSSMRAMSTWPRAQAQTLLLKI